MQVKPCASHGLVRGGCLSKALELYEKQIGLCMMDRHKDDHGTFAWSNEKHIVCAKSRPHFDRFGNTIISCHELIVRAALDNHLRILMYIDSQHRLFEFDPWEVVNDPTSTNNFRDEVMMVNFLLKLGRSPDQITLFTMDHKTETFTPAPEAVARAALAEGRRILERKR